MLFFFQPVNIQMNFLSYKTMQELLRMRNDQNFHDVQ